MIDLTEKLGLTIEERLYLSFIQGKISAEGIDIAQRIFENDIHREEWISKDVWSTTQRLLRGVAYKYAVASTQGAEGIAQFEVNEDYFNDLKRKLESEREYKRQRLAE